ncbi:hypothetical protein [Caballeronia cordobensis]|uniref:hypothetical protein n=1 Tax=Caballeronia cordobensis TaxID=1353886 RepID=UPI0006AD5F47|nr:hypothetical protein [Caballeronia cordobensis]
MFPTLKHALSSLAWYAKQDAEAWKMLSFLVVVVYVSTAWYAKQDAEAWKMLSFLVVVVYVSTAIASVTH